MRYSTLDDLITPEEFAYTPGIAGVAEGKVRYYAKHRQAHEREIRRLLAVQEQIGGSLSIEQQERLDQCWTWYWAEHGDVLRWWDVLVTGIQAGQWPPECWTEEVV